MVIRSMGRQLIGFRSIKDIEKVVILIRQSELHIIGRKDISFIKLNRTVPRKLELTLSIILVSLAQGGGIIIRPNILVLTFATGVLLSHRANITHY